MHRFALYLIAFHLSISYGQEDSLHHKELNQIDVIVKGNHNLIEPSTRKLDYKDIQELSPVDAGELLQKMPGVTVKSYGGLGGLKTVSFRGLGAHHTNISIDGFPVLNQQTGQVNLAQIQVDNIMSVSSSLGSDVSELLPVSAQVAGGAVLIKTAMFSYTSDSLIAKTSLGYGSFAQYDANGLVKLSGGNKFISAYAKMRGSEGNYPFVNTNGSAISTERRSNNLYEDNYVGFSTGYRFKNSTSLRIAYDGKRIDQQLPGAVILYNSTADEHLLTEEHKVRADVFLGRNSHVFRVFSVANNNRTVYFDPSYLNNAGFLRNEYRNSTLTGGILYSSQVKKNIKFHAGVEHSYSRLLADGQFTGVPERHQNYLLGGVKWTLKKVRLKAKITSQLIYDNYGKNNVYFRLSPVVSIMKSGTFPRIIQHRLEFRNSMRPPTFNELYYGGIGNTALDPEIANQLSYTWIFNPIKENRNLDLEIDVYSSLVKNKILAIPTKNLFVWSIQNIGKTGGAGIDLISNWQKELNSRMQVTVMGSYSYQLMLDLTDSENATYLHQIAYVPPHTANLDLGFSYKRTSFRFSNYFVSYRYVLNENIPANLEDGFLSSDIMMSYRQQFKEKSSFTIQGSIKNIFDVNYAYIRSFVMPGRNYLITLKYAFN